jgi:hypothetical protein
MSMNHYPSLHDLLQLDELSPDLLLLYFITEIHYRCARAVRFLDSSICESNISLQIFQNPYTPKSTKKFALSLDFKCVFNQEGIVDIVEV